MRGIKIPQQDFALKRQGGGGGGAYARGGAYLRDTTVLFRLSASLIHKPHLGLGTRPVV